MNGVIGDILPVALGVAVSPIPIIAAILMLLSPKARVTSVGFLLGWVVGIVLASTIFTLLASVLPSGDDDAPTPIKGIIHLVLGALLLVLALRNWRKRPGPGEEPEMPKWMQAIDSMSFAGAAGLGALLSGVNPKNLLLSASAGVTIGSAALGTGLTIAAIAVFTLIAASTVLVPVVGYLLAADRLRGPLDALRGWLARENALIMALLLLVLGVVLIGKGIGSF
ncbi:GAP family protein [Microbacterium sp. C7(2022)]|uniref:GAP family protein n=1 Tax=Microbacterium sp. C7(2022) TaxID=2992759 RepID=UPI00237AB190|nr:GAP family protein [Microbacterium sp. C7(2022)]MDE0545203.1 GAP family protein [Microbacterium sp. C7(2022)]